MLCQGATIAQPTAFCILACPRQGWNSCYLSTFSVPRSCSPSFPCSLSLCLKAKKVKVSKEKFFSLVSTALVPVSRVGVSFQRYPPARVFGKEKRRKKEGERGRERALTGTSFIIIHTTVCKSQAKDSHNRVHVITIDKGEGDQQRAICLQRHGWLNQGFVMTMYADSVHP